MTDEHRNASPLFSSRGHRHVADSETSVHEDDLVFINVWFEKAWICRIHLNKMTSNVFEVGSHCLSFFPDYHGQATHLSEFLFLMFEISAGVLIPRDRSALCTEPAHPSVCQHQHYLS